MKILLIIACLSTPAAFAQNLTRYYADECKVFPQRIEVAPNGLSYIEFHGTVDPGQAFSPGVNYITDNQQTIDSAEPADAGAVQYPFTALHSSGTNLVNITTSLGRAKTDLVVWVNGEPCNFILEVVEGLEGPQRYVIESQRPLPALGQDVPTQLGGLEAVIDFHVISVTPPSAGTATAFFTISNNGPSVVAADSTRVRFKQGGQEYRVEVRKDPLALLIQPGETHTGHMILKGAGVGEGEISWEIQEIKGSRREVTLSEDATPSRPR